MRFLSQYVHYADNLKETIEANYKRIKQEVLILVENETERIKADPTLKHFIKEYASSG